MVRPRRTQAQWQSIIEAYENSGLTGSVFCRREGINPKSFYRAKSKFTGAKQTPRFIQTKPVSVPPGEVTVMLPGCRIHCSSSVSSNWLAQVIRSLSR